MKLVVDDGKNDEKQKESVKEKLREQGFALELETYLALKKRGWFTSMQSFYTNVVPGSQNKSFLEIVRDTWNTPSEPNFRTIDIAAVKIISSKIPEIRTGSLTLIIECKVRKKENWVFYTESILENQAIGLLAGGVSYVGGDLEEALEILSFGEISTFGDLKRSQIKMPKVGGIVRSIRRTSHHSIKNMTRFALSHQSVFKPDSPDNIFNACRQVIEACLFYDKADPETIAKIIEDGNPINHWRVYPVVVFSGDIWEARFNENEEIQLEKQDWLTYCFPHKGDLYSIDIVSFKSLSEYLDMLDREVTMLEKTLSKEE